MHSCDASRSLFIPTGTAIESHMVAKLVFFRAVFGFFRAVFGSRALKNVNLSVDFVESVQVLLLSSASMHNVNN